jgi:hypothetical protein
MSLKVGQTVYLRPLNNSLRRGRSVESAVVLKIGSKFLTLEGPMWSLDRFYKDTLLHDGRGYAPSWQVYLSMQEIKDEDEKSEIISETQELFSSRDPKLSLPQLREIRKIILNKR